VAVAASCAACPSPRSAMACSPAPPGLRWRTEGPYFTRNSPLRPSLLEKGMGGMPLVLSGRVRSADCAIIPGALLDFWQADADGRYDNQGFRLRGHQFTDAQGRYRLETVMPGLYPGRTRHLHVKVQARDGPVLTTQLYFPGEAANRQDGLFSSALLVSVVEPSAPPAAGRVQASFDFVIRVA
jgi:protocatechuate 3,4-dioxygenase beta subunit